MPSLAACCRIVLVRPAIAANLGAVARVMRNFGLTDLRLVAPHADPLAEPARTLSTHGEAILHAAQSVPDLGAAVADCVLVAGTSARTGGPFRRQPVVTPRQLMPALAAAAASGPVALVFGPEQTGLTNAEVTRCHWLVTIPADEAYPVLNLAQAVAICAYELYQTWPAARPLSAPRDIAPFALQERLYARLREVLTDIHFLWGDNADTLLHALRHLLGRAQPSTQEVELLLGLARQLRWYVDHCGPPRPEPTPRRTLDHQ
jgi:tRNA/rRNA methyltransferase